MGEPDAEKNDPTWPPFEGLMDYKAFGPDGLEWIDSGGRTDWRAAVLTERGKTFVLR